MLNIYGVMQSVFRNAVVDEVIAHNPCTLTRDPRGCGDLPVVEDADPEWRASAKYGEAEVAQLLTDSRIPADRRMLYGLEFFSRCRHGEAAGMMWRHWLRDRVPLSCLLLTTSYNNGRTKTGVVREMPVHKVLEEMLGWWWSEGWQQVMGRAPTPDDLIVPAPPDEQVRRLSRKTELRIADLCGGDEALPGAARRKRGARDSTGWGRRQP